MKPIKSYSFLGMLSLAVLFTGCKDEDIISSRSHCKIQSIERSVSSDFGTSTQFQSYQYNAIDTGINFA